MRPNKVGSPQEVKEQAITVRAIHWRKRFMACEHVHRLGRVKPEGAFGGVSYLRLMAELSSWHFPKFTS